MADNASTRKLFDAVADKFDIGTYDEFAAKMDNPDSRQKFFNAISQSFDVGTFDEFSAKVASKNLPSGFFGGGQPSGKGAGGGYGTDILGALRSGYQQSVTGLLDYKAEPEPFKPINMTERIVQQVATLYGDAPAMFVGALVGTAAGGGVGSAVTGAGAALALPQALRKVLIDKYTKGEVTNFREFWDRLVGATIEATKGYVTGGASGAAGVVAPGVAKVPAEILALTAFGAGMEGRVPTAQDLLDNAVLLFGIKGASKGVKLLGKAYENTGKGPKEVVAEVAKDLGYAGSAEDKAALQALFSKEGSKAKIRESIKKLQELPIEEGMKKLSAAEREAKSTRALKERLAAGEYERLTGERQTISPVVPQLNKPLALLPDKASDPGYRSNIDRINYELTWLRRLKERDIVSERQLDEIIREAQQLEQDLASPKAYEQLKQQLKALEEGDQTKLDQPATTRSFDLSKEVFTRGKKRKIFTTYEIVGYVSERSVKMIQAAMEFINTQYPQLSALLDTPIGESNKVIVRFVDSERITTGSEADVLAFFLSTERGEVSKESPGGIRLYPKERIIEVRSDYFQSPYLSTNEPSWQRITVADLINNLAHEMYHNREYIKYGPERFKAERVPATKAYEDRPGEQAAGIAGEAAEARYRELSDKSFDQFISEIETELDGIGEALRETGRGLAELAGGQRLGITPQAFSDESYKAALPHFKRAWDNYKKAGIRATDFAADMINQFGEVARPYVDKFIADEGLKPITKGSNPANPAESLAAEIGSEIVYVPAKKDIHSLRQFINSPEFILRNQPEPLRHSSSIIEGQLKASHYTRVIDEAFINSIESEVKVSAISKAKNIAAQKKIRPAMEELYRLKDNPAEAQALIDSSPIYRAANRVIQWFENIRGELIEYKKQLYRLQMTDKLYKAFEEAIVADKTKLNEIAERNKVDPEELAEAVKQYKYLEQWGLDEFITNIERGTWRVIDSNGTVRAVAETRKEAKRKALDLRKSGKLTGRVEISPEFHKPIDPTKPREDILRGEENIIDALRTYSYVVRKKMALDPVEARMEKDFKNDEGQIIYTPNVRKLLRDQLIDARGRYSWGDELFDYLSRAYGGRPRLFSRSIGKIRTLVGYNKLGYRPVAAFVNFASGHGHTWVKVGEEYMSKGSSYLSTSEGKRFIIEEEANLGLDFASSATGRLVTKQKWYSPLKLFGLPEPGIRKLSLAANYLYSKEKLGMSEAAARESARRALRVQNFTYNVAALPRLLRGPGGRLVFQFKSYMIKELEFLYTLSGKEWARYLGMQVAMAGPRGFMLMLRSLPILGALGAFNKIEEWLLSKSSKGAAGIPGLIGVDISAPATFQVVSDRIEDLAGPFLSDTWRLYQVTVAPAIRGEKVLGEDVKDWARNLAPIVKYWDNIMQAEVTEDGWIRDKIALKVGADGKLHFKGIGLPRYQISGWWDKFYLGLGAATVEKSKQQLAQQILARDNEKDLNNRKKLFKQAFYYLDRNKQVPPDIYKELAMLGADIDGTLAEGLKKRQLSPQERALLRAKLVDKARAWGIFEE